MNFVQFLLFSFLLSIIAIKSVLSKRDKSEFLAYKRRLMHPTIKKNKQEYFSTLRQIQSSNDTNITPYTILVTPWPPLMFCTPRDSNQSDFSGFTFDIWA